MVIISIGELAFPGVWRFVWSMLPYTLRTAVLAITICFFAYWGTKERARFFWKENEQPRV